MLCFAKNQDFSSVLIQGANIIIISIYETFLNKNHYSNFMSAKKEVDSSIHCVLGDRIAKVCEKHTGIKHETINNSKIIHKETCLHCGQCIKHDSIHETEDMKKVLGELKTKKKVIACIAPAVRVSLGEEFGYPAGTIVTKKVIGALKKLGFSKVFDIVLGADLMVMEKTIHFMDRINKQETPMFTTCCPAWIKYIEIKHPEMKHLLSTIKSPQGILATLIKKYYTKKNNLKEKNVIVVNIMPCIAKKFEIKRPEYKDTDYVLTTKEFADLLKIKKIDLNNVKEKEFDKPLGESSGAGTLFGGTGGLTEAVFSNAKEVLKDSVLTEKEKKKLRQNKEVKKGTITIQNKKIKYVIVNKIKNIEKIIQEIKQGTHYDFIEVMACPSGCIGGGGQPCSDKKILDKRLEALHRIYEEKKVKTSKNNSELKQLYEDVLNKKAKTMLYIDRK